jgi:lipoprotein-releasing system permease protein
MFSFFVARRYFAQALKTKSMALPLWFSIIILFIASFGLSLALSITSAFQEKTFEKFETTNAHALISSYGNKLDFPSIAKKISNALSPHTAGITPQSSHSLIITSNDKQALVQLRSIDLASQKNVINLGQKLISADKNLAKKMQKNCFIVGSTLAHNLEITPNTTVTCYVPKTIVSSKKIQLSEKELMVSDQFALGLDEFDSGIVFCSQETFTELTKSQPNTADVILVKFASEPDSNTYFFEQLNPFSETYTEKKLNLLRAALPEFNVQSWKELYPAIISAMKLEQFGVMCILFLLALIALFSITSSLVTLIYHKQRDIALFMTMGMPQHMIRKIFLWVGMIIVVLSSLAGSLCSYAVSFILETYKCIPLPDVYYVSYLPASTQPFIFIAIPICICISSILILLAGIWQAQKMNSLETLRHTT